MQWRKRTVALISLALGLILLLGCGQAASPTPLPSLLPLPPATIVTLSPTAIAAPSVPTAQRTPTPTPTLRILPTPVSPTPIDDSYQPNDYVVLLNMGFDQRQAMYLTPEGNLKPVLPPEVADYCMGLSAAGQLLCTNTEEPGSLVVLDLVTGMTSKRESWTSDHWGAYLAMGYSVISADGRWVASLEDWPGRGRLSAWDVQEGNTYTVTTEQGSLGTIPVTWSAVTGKIYWTLGAAGSDACCWGLWGADPDGSGQIQLLDREVYCWSLSPGQTAITCLAYNSALGQFPYGRGGSPNELYFVDLLQEQGRLLWQAPVNCTVDKRDWLTDHQVIFSQLCPQEQFVEWNLLVLDLATQTVSMLWSDRAEGEHWSGWYVSPNGSLLMLVDYQGAWWRIDPQTGEKNAMQYPSFFREQTWCAGGQTLVYVEDRRRILRLDVATGETAVLWSQGAAWDSIEVIACR